MGNTAIEQAHKMAEAEQRWRDLTKQFEDRINDWTWWLFRRGEYMDAVKNDHIDPAGWPTRGELVEEC